MPEEPNEPPLPLETPVAMNVDCGACHKIIPPGIVRVPMGLTGRVRHVIGSPLCDPPPPTEDACPTCGRAVAEGAPYDTPTLRKVLTEALAALDALEKGQQAVRDATQEASEELGDVGDIP